MKHSVRTSFLTILSACGLATLVSCGGPTKYESASFADSSAVQKSAGNYWKRDGWWGGLPKDVTKVAITQFSVEYVTQNTSKTGADALSILGAAEMIGMGKRKREFPEETKQQIPTPLYQQFVEALKAEGIEVVPMEQLTGQPSFAKLKTSGEGKTYGQGKGNESAKLQSYSVKGLPMIDDGWFNAGDNIKAEWKAAGDTGAQAAMRVRMRVGLDDDGHAVLGGGSTIHIVYEPKKEQWIANQPAEWMYKQKGALVSQGAFRDDVAVVDSKEFKAFQGDIYTINGPKYQESILKMYPTYARMAVVKMKS